MKQLFFTLIAVTTFIFASCDSHADEEDFEGISPTRVVCTDGNIYGSSDISSDTTVM